ncbi:Hypothetical protein SMAX5B_003192 [Scophthalmus maximus]|uniref:Uncharacterized protein n=1 Tax=Scophthalmus maximus TaxID=52904 RepID=A0A2U9CZB1_SCOMX|nr:Hypothetical protein SMAX5B_003192 [Scophthalmus maximus]
MWDVLFFPDDDDSKSQDKSEGILGVQQTAVASASGGSGTSSGVSADQNTGSSLDLPAGADSVPPHTHTTVINRVCDTHLLSVIPVEGHVHHQTDIGVDQSGGDHSSPSSGPDQSLPGSASGSSHSTTQQEAAAASSSSSVGDAHREQTAFDCFPGNGRQTHLTDETGVTDRPVPLSDLQTDLTGVLSHTDLVTVATDFTVTDTVSADPTGSPAETSHPAVTDHTQAAGSVTEQYNPSGQGPEGAENVELEDSC